MPNKKSAAKRVRQSEKRREHNRAKRSDMRTQVKAVRKIVDSGNLEGAEAKLSEAQAKIDKAAKTNLIKKRTAQRKISRLARAINRAKSQKA